MITTLLIFFPLLAGAVLLAMRRGKAAFGLSLAAAAGELVLSLYALSGFRSNAERQFEVNVSWIKSMGISFHAGMDGISLLLVLLTTFLSVIIIMTSYRRTFNKPALFYALIMFMEGGLVGVFTAADGFLFYVFWELALIPVYFICLMWGGEGRERITLKFFIYTLAGSLLLLLGLLYLYLKTPVPHSFDITALYEVPLTSSEQVWIFWAMFIAFAIKMPVFPFHTWQPDTYTAAPAQGTMLLSGIMLKMGVYGLIRWLIPVVPAGIQEWGYTALLLSVTGIVYASAIAIVQRDFKRLIAYSSIAHVGLISAGVFSLNLQGLQGAVVQMLSHGVNVVGLFFVADILLLRTGTNDISGMGGIRNRAPWFATVFMIILLGAVALPLTNGFVGEFLLLGAIYQRHAWMTAAAGLSVILGAVYMLNSYQKIMLGENNTKAAGFRDLDLHEKIIFIPVVAMVIGMGVYPAPILRIAEPALKAILVHAGLA